MKTAKTQRLPERPKPPTLEQVIADIESTDDDDVVFRIASQEYTSEGWALSDPSPDLSAAMQESFMEISPDSTEKSELGMSSGDQSQFEGDVANSYNKVLQLISIQSNLQTEPRELLKKYENLETLGSEVSDAISDLRKAADTVLKKT